MLDDNMFDQIMKDVKDGAFDALGVATPCETFSPLRENPPGPRPVRSMEHPLGMLSEEFNLTQSEIKQVKEGNSLIGASQEAIEGFLDLKLPFWWENPDHGDDKVDMWKTPMAADILRRDEVHLAALDQCVFGAETTKPTIFAYANMDLSTIGDKRCSHEVREFKRADLPPTGPDTKAWWAGGGLMKGGREKEHPKHLASTHRHSMRSSLRRWLQGLQPGQPS